MISKKFLGIFGIFVLIIGLANFIPNLSAAGSGSCSCRLINEPDGGNSCLTPNSGDPEDHCGPGYIPSGSCSVIPGPPASCSPVGCTCIPAGNCGGGCGTNTCPTDSCSGATYFDYDVYGSGSQSTCSNSCVSGACNQCTCNPISQTCTSALANQSGTCSQSSTNCGGGSWEKCRMSNSGVLEWTTSFGSETSCSDGYDNDCNGLVDCQDSACSSAPNCITTTPSSPKLIFRQGPGPSNAAVIGSNGLMDIRGTNFSNQPSITSSSNDFIVKDSAGNIVALITYNGNIYLKGRIYENQVNLNNYLIDASKQLIIKTAAGNVVAVFDQSGNLYLKGNLRKNQPSP